MNTRQVAFQTLKYLISDAESVEDLQAQDLEKLVKFTLVKMGMPPSLISDEDQQDILGEVQEGLQKYLESKKTPTGKAPKISSLAHELWYREVVARAL